MKNFILLTALPRTGKSTLVKKLIEQMGIENFYGFFTEEIRNGDNRVGFKINEIGGDSFVFAHTDIESEFKISRYNVDLDAFDNFISKFSLRGNSDKILVIDEIGPMQCLSLLFRKKLVELFNLPIVVLGTVFFNDCEWIDELKKSDKIKFFNLTVENRDNLAPEIIENLRETSKHFVNLQDELSRKNTKSEGYLDLFKTAPKSENGAGVIKFKIKTEHGIREIVDAPILGMSCNCEFYKKANTCSHIMAYAKIKENL